MGKLQLYIGDKTSPCPECGEVGDIVSGDHRQTNGLAVAVDGSAIRCGCPPGTNWLIAPGVVEVSDPLRMPVASGVESVQYAQTAKARPAMAVPAKAPPEPLPLPARIYTTQRLMDDYDAKDMHYGDLSEEELKGRFGLTDVSAKVNPYTLTLVPSVPVGPYGGFYPGSLTEGKPVVVSLDESARLMFDEFRALARVFSFHGPYKNLIMEMISHMQGNSGRPYSSPLLDEALKEQILNDYSSDSSLLSLKKALKTVINYEYGVIPLTEGITLKKAIQDTILPKFTRAKDNSNGLVITVHDTWATHITLESLEVAGDTYRAKVHYRVQDHFGLDNADILNSVFHQGRIFRLWFVLQRYVKYGYRPFITEINATVEISGRQDE
ncbi:DUF3289 family protein [Leclercia adecarboxylata]|nr:DUF3289 family protein [Leclercia adecarboxylata]